MRVAIGVRDGGLAASAYAVVAAAGAEAVRVDDLAGVATSRAAVALLVADLGLATELAGHGTGSGSEAPPTVIVVSAHEPAGPAWRVAAALPAAVVALPDGEPLLLDAVLDAAARALPSARVVAVTGCGGGAGASTLATVLAGVAARGATGACLVDLDSHGGGLDVLCGAERAAGLRWDDLCAEPARVGPALTSHLPHAGDLALLVPGRSGSSVVPPPLAAGAVTVAAASGLVVVDLPSWYDAEPVLTGCTDALLVCTGQVRSASAAARLTERWEGLPRRLRVVVVETAGAALPARDVADAVGLPLAAAWSRDPGAGRAAATGSLHRWPARGRRLRWCRGLLDTMPPAAAPAPVVA